MPSPNLGLVTTDLAPEDVFDIPATLQPDLRAIDQALGGLGATGANLLVNPGFDVNQRGAASYTGDTVYTLDRWQIAYIGAVALVVSRDASVFDALSGASARCAFTKGAGASATLEQLIESWAVLGGQTVTLRVRVKCGTPNAARAVLSDGVGTASGSAYHTGGGGWETLTVSRAIDAAATTLKAAAQFTADCTAYLDNATLALGSTPLPFAPLHSGDNLSRCEKYYEVHGGAAGFPYVRGYSAAAAGDVASVAIPWRQKKGGLPTVTKVGTWAANNAAQPTIANANQDGYLLQLASLAAGYFDAGPNSADDFVVGEWNPT